MFVGRPDLTSPDIDLSEALSLHGVTFGSSFLNLGWVVAALETITRKNNALHQVTIYVFDEVSGGPDVSPFQRFYREWTSLDRLLVEFWESRSIIPKLQNPWGGEDDPAWYIRDLLPESTRREILNLVY